MVGRWQNGWFAVPHLVIFRDLDAIGHVNHAVFLTYFEVARTLLWFDLQGGSRAHDIGFIVAHAECDFRHQLGMGPIEIRVRIGEMRTTSLDFFHEVRIDDGRRIAGEGKVVAVLYDWTTKTKVNVSDEFRHRVAAKQRVEG